MSLYFHLFFGDLTRTGRKAFSTTCSKYGIIRCHIGILDYYWYHWKAEALIFTQQQIIFSGELFTGCHRLPKWKSSFGELDLTSNLIIRCVAVLHRILTKITILNCNFIWYEGQFPNLLDCEIRFSLHWSAEEWKYAKQGPISRGLELTSIPYN